MHAPCVRLLVFGVLAASLAFAGCGSGSDGADGTPGPQGPPGEPGAPGGSAVDVTTASPEYLETLALECVVTNVAIASPPVVTFTVTTSEGLPVVGLGTYFDPTARSAFFRFTLTKLVPGTAGGPNAWVAYVRDEDGEPTYDKGTSLVDNGDGSYVFTFVTDVATVEGVPYEPSLTHRVAGQIGASSAPFEPMNTWLDYVPAGGAVTEMRNIAVMDSCNECHDNLVFHGRRFEVEYCVQCHNPDLAQGEGDMAFMTHRIHAAGAFAILDDAIDYSEVTYPQDLANCRKCHNGADADTPQGDNWMNVPSIAACSGCHDELEPTHGGGGGGASCLGCHNDGVAPSIATAHLTANATPNNPDLLPGQFEMTYELVDATVDGSGVWTVNFKVLADGVALDLTNLPADFNARRPGMLLAYAMPQDGFDEPMDYNNMGMRGGQPLSVDLSNPPTVSGVSVGSLTYAGDVNTVVIDNATYLPPATATLRAAGLQGYFQQIIGMDTVSLHTPSAVVAVTGDDARREVVDNDSCAQCHEWFEGHGGNRVYDIAICTLCHLPNQTSSGRTINPSDNPVAGDLGTDILGYPEDAQNLKDMIHGIHAEGFRDRHFEHVRGPTRESYYDWSHITFPRGAETSNCMLCHQSGTYGLPLASGLLATTVRTTDEVDGDDAAPTYSNPGDPGFPFSTGGVEDAFQNVPNLTDWVNTPTASSCFYCHTSADAMAHMMQNGGLLSVPNDGPWTNRIQLGSTFESCAVCHGSGKTADVEVVHAGE